jgi:hypothetical protein
MRPHTYKRQKEIGRIHERRTTIHQEQDGPDIYDVNIVPYVCRLGSFRPTQHNTESVVITFIQNEIIH